MPIAHICPSCGTQLAHLRAAPDPVYSLPLIRCDCGHAVVRRRHPLVAGYRRVRGAFRAIVYLLLQLFVLILLSLATGGFIASFQRTLADLRLTPLAFGLNLVNPSRRSRGFQSWIDYDAGLVFLIGFALVSLAAGIWLRAAFAHWRWPRPLLAWAIVVSAWVWMESLLWPLTWLDGLLAGSPARYSGLRITASIHCLQMLGVSLLLSLAAAPIGRAASRSLASSRRRRFTKALNKRRKARRGE